MFEAVREQQVIGFEGAGVTQGDAIAIAVDRAAPVNTHGADATATTKSLVVVQSAALDDHQVTVVEQATATGVGQVGPQVATADEDFGRGTVGDPVQIDYGDGAAIHQGTWAASWQVQTGRTGSLCPH